MKPPHYTFLAGRVRVPGPGGGVQSVRPVVCAGGEGVRSQHSLSASY